MLNPTVKERMLEILDSPDKWAKGEYRFKERYCLTGALSEVLDTLDLFHVVGTPEYQALILSARKLGFEIDETKQVYTLSFVNDMEETTYDDIIRIIQNA